jgi:6-hydroxynicotinate 3-monooxygenase
VKTKPRIAVIGAGLGGTAGAALLARRRFRRQAVRTGARLLASWGRYPRRPECDEDHAPDRHRRRTQPPGFASDYWYSRDGKTGDILAQIPLGDYAVSHYGASYLTVHRGDFHALMTAALPPGILEFNKRLSKVDDLGDKVQLSFADGSVEEADIVIGADGVNSRLREHLLGVEPPKYTGLIAHRAVFQTPVDSGPLPFDMCVKWWADDRHMMVYFVTGKRDEIYYVTGVPEAEWDLKNGSLPSSQAEMRETFAGWHRRCRR